MAIFKKLFSKPVTSKELKVALIGLERDRKKKHIELRKLDAKKNKLIDQIKKARKEGNNFEVDYLWEELNQVKVDSALTRQESRILNLEGIGLKKYIRGLARLEREGNKDGVKRLLDRVKKSNLDDKLAGQGIKESDYIRELAATLEEVGLDDLVGEAEEDSPEKAEFLAKIDEINAAEEVGRVDEAEIKKASLKSTLEEDDISA